MNLSDTARAHIRDYVGSESPTDDTLDEYAETATYWQEVALRVLRRRRADAASGDSVTSFTLTGVLSVGQKSADLSTLDAAINDLETQLAALTGATPPGGVSYARITRTDRYR